MSTKTDPNTVAPPLLADEGELLVGGLAHRHGLAVRSGPDAGRLPLDLVAEIRTMRAAAERQGAEQLRLQRSAISVNLLSRWDRTMVGARDLIDGQGDALRSSRLTKETRTQFISQSQELRLAARTVLGFYEDVSIFIQDGSAEERPLYRSLVYVVQKDWMSLEDYVVTRRLEITSDFYREVERLAQAWSQGKFLSNGRDADPDLPRIAMLETRLTNEPHRDPTPA